MNLPNLLKLPLLMLTIASLPPLPASSSEPAPTQAAANFEVDFMSGMIQHHLMGVAMAEVCLEKAVTPELEELCHSIIEVQTAEAETMMGWLRDWYGITYQAKEKPGKMKTLSRLEELSGEEFEIEFLEMMIRHHTKAIREASRCERRAYHVELKELCISIEESQVEEIKQMESWLCSWYGQCQ